MPFVSPQELQKLERNQKNIRNICIVAHVDHGKTTIADCLISTNGIISQRSAGKLRYMDNTAYEQARGITVKSSCISLQYVRPANTSGQEGSATEEERSYLINLIDSPGHMDFSGEVSSALRMTDGCFLVVDAIEGVCIQTRAVLRQAWEEKVKPVLVINKIDKLFSQLQLSPEEAYRQLLRVLEQVNLVLGELWIERQILDADSAHMARLNRASSHANDDEEGTTIDVDAADGDDMPIIENEEFEFSPALGNVVFASAMHGWGFSIDDFVELYATKLKMNRKILRRTLWGEYYYNPKTRKILTRRPNAGAQTMFASLVLSNIHQVYSAVLGTVDDMAKVASHKGYSSLQHRDLTKLERIDKSLGLSVPPRELKNEDMNSAISSVMGRWLPISRALLESAISLPDPALAQHERISILWHKSTHDLSPSGIQLQNNLHKSLTTADRTPDAPVLAYVSKVFAVPNEQFAKSSRIKLEPGKKTLIAMTRLFSGSLKVGDSVNILAPRYNPSSPEKHLIVAKIPQLWMLMGPDLQPIDEVHAGTVFGIGGESLDLHLALTAPTPTSDTTTESNAEAAPAEEEKPRVTSITISTADRNAFVTNIVKTATLTNVVGSPVFGALTKHVNPIVRVAVEPESPSDLAALEAGMWLLHQADAAVHVEVQENGEFIIGALGELHLTRCLELLRDEFARVPIKVSQPIVSFRETVLPGLAIDPDTRTPVATELVVERSTERQVTVVLRTLRLPENITTWLETHAEESRVVHQLTQGIQQQHQQQQHHHQDSSSTTSSSTNSNHPDSDESGFGRKEIRQWTEALRAEFEACESPEWRQMADFVWALGPHRIGPNILVNNIPQYSTSRYWKSALNFSSAPAPQLPNPASLSDDEISASGFDKETLAWFGVLQQLDAAVRSGFQLATRAGPLCEEPLMGVCVQILDVNVVYTPHGQEEAVTVPQKSYLLPDLCAGGPSDGDLNIRAELEKGSVGGIFRSADDESEDDGKTKDERLSAVWSHAVGFSGGLISATRNAIRRAFQARPQRLYEAMYLAHVQVTAVNMGKAYAVLNRRRSDIISDDVNESSGLTLVVALVPAAEAFGFSEELVAKSGGAANAQLAFNKWQELDVDPNFIPSTEEELEEFGENVGGIAPNLARKYVDGVRRRKGLAIHEKLIEGANKQRTLSKKK